MAELDSMIPVNPPIVNKKMNPIDHRRGGFRFIFIPCRVEIHLKTLIPVGTAIIMVAEVK